MLGDGLEGSAEPLGDLRAGLAVKMQAPDPAPRHDQLASEQVHLDLAALPPAVVYNAVFSDGRRLGRARRINLQDYVRLLIISQGRVSSSCPISSAW